MINQLNVSDMAYAFILNPSANRTRAQKAEEWLREHVATYWPGSKILVTSSKSDIKRAVSEAANEYSILVACGGDGTVNETFSRIVDMLPDYPNLVAGVLPMGSGNDFAKSVGLSTNPRQAIEQLRSNSIEPIDYVEYKTNLGSGYMFNTMNLGLGGQINWEAAKVKKLKGPLIYVYAALKSLLKVVKCDIRVNLDGISTDESMVMLTIANGAVEGGNFKVAPNANNTDGMLDIVTVGPLNALFLLPLLPLFLIAKQHWYPIVSFRTGTILNLSSNKAVPLHVDGEQCGMVVDELSVRVVTHGLRVLKPVTSV
jgi:diacylglycerol kinase (ATP)